VKVSPLRSSKGSGGSSRYKKVHSRYKKVPAHSAPGYVQGPSPSTAAVPVAAKAAQDTQCIMEPKQ
jgi:hypothetical protein